MVSRLTLGSKKYVEVHEPIKEILQRSESMRSKLANLIDRDAEAFEKVLRAYKMPKGSDGEEKARGAAIERGLVEAIAVPLETMELAEGVLELASRVAAVGNVKAISDAGVAAYMAEAAVRSAALNVRINAAALADESERRRSLTRAERSLEAVRTKIAAVEAAVLKKI
jgi:formiminotetrahydrofolate cyclodeaminase